MKTYWARKAKGSHFIRSYLWGAPLLYATKRLAIEADNEGGYTPVCVRLVVVKPRKRSKK